jgi:chemotaxis protein CheC
MTELSYPFPDSLRPLLEVMAGEGVHHAADGLSGMIGHTLDVSQPEVRLVPLADLPMLLGGPESEAVGIYLQATGGMAGQIMLVLPYLKALELVDLLQGEAPGTTQELGRLERSALAEVGNMAGTFFLNSVALLTGVEARPSPPAVMVDMVGAILDIIVAASRGLGEHVLMIQAAFLRDGREVEADFWVIPDQGTLEAFAQQGLADGE